MATVRPFRPLRYSDPTATATQIAPPYDVIDVALRATLAGSSPHNVVHLDLPSGDGDAKYAEAQRLLAAWQAEGVLTRADKPALYTYEQRFKSPVDGSPKRRAGFFAAVRLEPYDARVILPHERTLSGPKEDRRKLLEATRTALSPGFLLYRGQGEQARLEDTSELIAEFSTRDGVQHRFAKVTDAATLNAVSTSLQDAQLLIADGHHRYETALRYSDLRGEDADAASRYGLFFLVDENDPELLVLPTHRIVHGLSGFDAQDFFTKLAQWFTFTHVEPNEAADPSALLGKLAAAARPSFVVQHGDRSVLVSLREEIDPNQLPGERPTALRTLDVVLLHDLVLEQLLGISREAQAAKTNLRYMQDASNALEQARTGAEGAQLTFVLNATPPRDVRRMAEAGEVMPQKSTFFFPKVPTGLLFLPLEGAL